MTPFKDISAPSQLLLIFTFLTALCLGFRFPAPGSLTTRVQGHSINNSDFTNSILTRVNHYRAEQNAQNLTWSPELTLIASNWTNDCKFTTSAADGKGDTSGGVTVSATKPSDTLIRSIEKVVDGWYSGRLIYHNPNVTHSTPDSTSYAHQYAQMVWKASKQIGCAFSSASCSSVGGDRLHYLVCKYDPPGNIHGKLNGNVSCNDYVSDTSERDKSMASSLPPRDVNATISNACVPPGFSNQPDEQSDFIDTLKAAIDYERAFSGANPTTLDWNLALEAAARRAASNCTINTAYGGPGVKTAYFSKAKVTGETEIDTPFNLTLAAIQYWQNWQEEPEEEQDGYENYVALTDLTVNAFGCAWSDWNACSRYNLYCFFWNATCPNELSFADDLPGPPKLERGIAGNEAPGASNDVPSCGHNDPWKCFLEENFFSARVFNNVSENHWSETLASLAQKDAETCRLQKAAKSPAVEINFMKQVINQTNVDITVGWDAIHAWQRSAHPGARPDYTNVVNDYLKYFGCGFAACKNSSYVLNCIFSPWYDLPEDLTTRSGTPIIVPAHNFDLNNQTGDFFANLREDRGLPADCIVLQQWPGLSTDTKSAASRCDDFTPKTSEIWSNTSATTIVNKTNPWPEVLQDTELSWYASRFAGSPEDPRSETTYALIVHPNTKYYWCASHICNRRQKNESYHVVCAFSNSTTSAGGDGTVDVATRDIKPFNLTSSAAYMFAALRASIGLSIAAQNLTQSWILQLQAEGDASQCSGVVRDPNSEIYYEVLTDTIKDKTNLWYDMFVEAFSAWLHSSAEDATAAHANGFIRPFDVMMDPDFKSFGCAWSPICNLHADDESYQLYCAFSNDTAMQKRNDGTVEDPPQNIGTFDLNKVDGLRFSEIRVRDAAAGPTMDPN